MGRLWVSITFAGIAGLSLSNLGCDTVKRWVSPRMEKLTIGTRQAEKAPLDVKAKAGGRPLFLGCDLRYANIPSDGRVKLTWYVYDSEAARDDGKFRQHSDTNTQSLSGTGVFNGHLESLDPKGFAPGVYECRWEASSKSGRTILGAEQSASIVVGDLEKLKASDEGDGDAPKKKKKKAKKSDDDE
jgi:hypothetical protein